MAEEAGSSSTGGGNAKGENLVRIVTDRVREVSSGAPPQPLVVCGPAATVNDAIRRCHPVVPPDWFGGAVTYQPGQVLDDWRRTLSTGIEIWLQARPGLRALREAAALLDEPGTPAATALNRVTRELADVPGPVMFAEIADLDPGEPDADRLLTLLGWLQRGGAPVFVVASSSVHPSFAAASSAGAELIEIIDLTPVSASAYASAVEALSPDARRYFRSIVAEPGSHEDLRIRLGDSTAFGGGSKLGEDFAELRRAGVLRISDGGVLEPTLPDLVEMVG